MGAMLLCGGFCSICAQSQHPCSLCHGAKRIAVDCPAHCHNGAILCPVCQGSGHERERCRICHGSGTISETEEIRCDACQGRGSFKENQPKPCTCRGGKRPVTTRGGNVTYVDCQNCGGDGLLDNWVTVTCRSCHGSGVAGTRTTRVPCDNCDNGYNTSDCSNCRGRGSVRCDRCQGYASIMEDCPKCHGTGYQFALDE